MNLYRCVFDALLPQDKYIYVVADSYGKAEEKIKEKYNDMREDYLLSIEFISEHVLIQEK